MPTWSRRDLLKTSLAASAGVQAGLPARAEQAESESVPPARAATSPRERLLLDFGWRFQLGHANDPERDFGLGQRSDFSKAGRFVAPARADYDDSQWQAIDLPHDWAITLPFVRSEKRDIRSYGFKPLGRVFPETSIGWYRKAFEVPASDLGRRLSLEFDGAFRNAMVVFNGHYLGVHPSGYAPFQYDVTDFVNCGGKNILLVRVDATQSEGWFYEGAGIYRHVWLVKTQPVHVAQWGTLVASAVTPEGAEVAITTEVANDSDKAQSCRVVSTVLDPAGKAVGSAAGAAVMVEPWSVRTLKQRVKVAKPALWSLETPNLYRVATTVEAGGAAADRYETTFGIRTIRFDADKGFFLNGKHVVIYGTCNHQDHAGVGAALPDRLQSYRIEKLKEMGCNAYRSSHNHPTPELLDACDRLGMLVMDETRTMDAHPQALEELAALVRRDRNHPSVVMWSLGNEEPEQGGERGARIVDTMKRLARKLDPTRVVTMAMNNGFGGKGVSNVVDVQGFNYNENQIDKYRKEHPQQPLLGSETASTVSTRGIYANDKEKGYLSAYDVNAPRWGSIAEKWWKFYAERPWLAGGFVWTGFDYRGEPTPSGWPCISSHFGLMDTCGFPKDIYYYYQAWWSGKPVLHLFPHWTWSEGQDVEVWCFTNQERVELFVNGQSQGAKDVEKNGHASWKVKYAPGAIEARAFAGGKQTLTAKRETAGKPARIVLQPDRVKIAGDGEDVSVIVASVVDGEGRMAPTASNEIEFVVSGAGKLKGVGNGDPSCHESDLGPKRSAFSGLAMAIIQAGKQAGAIEVTAKAAGLEGASVTIECAKVTPRPTA